MNKFLSMVKAQYVLAEEIFTDESGKYWGDQGAGGIFYVASTKRLCFALRSPHVNEPNTWGTWGGGIEGDESPETAVRREVSEEAGYHGPMDLQKVYVFKDKNFRYFNFLIIVPKEFTPKLNWETSSFSWVTVNSIPSPLHPGAAKLLPHLKAYLAKL